MAQRMFVEQRGIWNGSRKPESLLQQLLLFTHLDDGGQVLLEGLLLFAHLLQLGLLVLLLLQLLQFVQLPQHRRIVQQLGDAGALLP